ncbi:vasoactive intestinal polypeptide receptor 2-like [Anthonomus grandis grandis]|uniref:vasoactive intestinal polypeptide receptor 2-like n=1 Tax=Anthonomus grandis grandis TaxID=2921223 RepID=UPI002165C423|nr:vasoactive intestinal polypeptide receptor 2-like [Anthonomus grandis grandis]XP_050316252.1 vasoactive intestinal polypeptide receptor 2-like [Anthonomus grandis grandis]XP_050316262.1 vasoactive intestinal polypeptide receptor 2-like [Anthonomus grandis grandis]XP_050316272.1 vasoactive intestinal polypeptide receptor 2-like [Anthonomus grandis grandis]
MSKHVQKVVDYQDEAINRAFIDCVAAYGPNLRSNVPITNSRTNQLMCPPYFDTLYCWPPQLANTTSSVACPSYILGFLPTNKATRRCEENGEWFTRNGNPYTNYSECSVNKTITIYTSLNSEDYITNADQGSVYLIKILSETGYAVSLVSLIIAFTIMFKIKKLHCARNILHMNLFASFILRSFMHILKDALFEDGLGLSKDLMAHNGTTFFHVDATMKNFECKLIVSLVQYFSAANHSWILMEGVYLNNLILRALFTDSNRNLAYYIIFGWGLPLLVVVPWVVARILVEDTFCWTTNDNFKVFAIILVPSFTSVLINLVLFIIISVVLYKKLKSPVNEDSRRYLKWAKSTLVLVPLFGVNYAFFLIFYFLGQKLIWMLCDMLFGSFQGFFVAILYCFMNGEVKAELKPYVTSTLTFLATNNVTKYCFPGREKYLRSADGRQSVCTTMSCSSLYNNGLNPNREGRTSKTKCDQLMMCSAKVKLTSKQTDHPKENQQLHCYTSWKPSNGTNGHYVPNLTFIHGRYPIIMTTNVDSSPVEDMRVHHHSQTLPTCEEEMAMLEETNIIEEKLKD